MGDKKFAKVVPITTYRIVIEDDAVQQLKKALNDFKPVYKGRTRLTINEEGYQIEEL